VYDEDEIRKKPINNDQSTSKNMFIFINFLIAYLYSFKEYFRDSGMQAAMPKLS